MVVWRRHRPKHSLRHDCPLPHTEAGGVRDRWGVEWPNLRMLCGCGYILVAYSYEPTSDKIYRREAYSLRHAIDGNSIYSVWLDSVYGGVSRPDYHLLLCAERFSGNRCRNDIDNMLCGGHKRIS